MKLIVGLGNPGKEYEKTRHNIGFRYIDYFAKKNNCEISNNKFNGLYGTLMINGEKVILLKPQSYMNLSGEVVRKFVDYFNIKIEDILIINDDLDMEVGKIKLKQNGSSGGHNGLKNIALHLNTEEYKRLKVGISNNKEISTKDYVLGKFNQEDEEKLNSLNETISNIINDFNYDNFDKLMNKYNKK